MSSNRRAGLALVVALIAAMVPVPGRSSDGYGCPRPPMPPGWRTPGAVCRVKLQGLPMTVYGNAIGPGASVHVSLVIESFADVVIVECSATDANPPPIDNVAECSNVVVIDQDVLVPLPEGTVRCRVEGTTSPAGAPGDYFCRTGSQGLPV